MTIFRLITVVVLACALGCGDGGDEPAGALDAAAEESAEALEEKPDSSPPGELSGGEGTALKKKSEALAAELGDSSKQLEKALGD